MHVWPIVLFAASVAALGALSWFFRRKAGLLYYVAAESDAASTEEYDTFIFAEEPGRKRKPSQQQRFARPRETVHLVMQVVVTVAILGTSLFIILSHHFDDKDKNWAYGSAGTLLGYWLKK